MSKKTQMALFAKTDDEERIQGILDKEFDHFLFK